MPSKSYTSYTLLCLVSFLSYLSQRWFKFQQHAIKQTRLKSVKMPKKFSIEVHTLASLCKCMQACNNQAQEELELLPSPA